MKFFHTADWHLGKLVQGVYMTEDQRYILQQFLEAIEKEKPDAIIIAGDLYDRAIPPVDAVNLLDDTLAEIVLKRKIPVIAISGNHDSPTRLQFGSKLMQDAGLYLAGEMKADLKPVVLEDEHGEVHFHLIPFAEPSIIRQVFGNRHVSTYDDAMKETIAHIQQNMKQGVRHVAVAHAFVTPYGEDAENTSDSERPLAIGGSEYVNAAHFAPFDYTALGHLHKAHYVLQENIRYAGSPLKYSLSEAAHEKGFYIVELAADGAVKVEKRKLIPRRDIRIIEGEIQQILRHQESDDYVFVRLTDPTPVINAMEQIRTVYKNALHVERKTIRQTEMKEKGLPKREKLDDLSLFQAFYGEVTKQEPSDMMLQLFKEALNELLVEEREGQEVGAK